MKTINWFQVCAWIKSKLRNQFTEVEKESLKRAKESASNAVGSMVASFKKNEQRLVRVVWVRSTDAGAAVMRFIKRKTETGNDEIFEIEEENDGSPDSN